MAEPQYIELDRWAFELENEFENNPGANRAAISRKHRTICLIKKRLYQASREMADKKSLKESGRYSVPVPSWCPERSKPPRGGSGVTPPPPPQPPPVRYLRDGQIPKVEKPLPLELETY